MSKIISDLFLPAFQIAIVILPFILPVTSAIIVWIFFKEYANDKFRAKNPSILLEIKMPREIKRSPLAMELVLTGLYIPSRETTWIDRNIKGQYRPVFSLEIASFGGDIHFYVRTEEGLRNLVEAQLYAQYPSIEIHMAPDYTAGVEYIPGVTEMHATEFIKEKTHGLPIKTYVEYGLDRDDEEYFKIDPMTPMLELLGSLKPNEQVWFQIMIRAHKKEQKVYDAKKKKNEKVDWRYDANKEKEKILKDIHKPLDEIKPGERPAVRQATEGEKSLVAALERNISKIPFDTGLRIVYLAPKADFRGVIKGGIGGVVGQYNTFNLNGFKRDHGTNFDYVWQDYNNMRLNKRKKNILKYYQQRKYWSIKEFNLFKGLIDERKNVVMSTEELATMFHLPGEVATTPTFSRIMSRKAEAPTNLPV